MTESRQKSSLQSYPDFALFLTPLSPPAFPIFFPPSAPLQVLLMQESVRRIIEAEESKMGESIYAHTIKSLHSVEKLIFL